MSRTKINGEQLHISAFYKRITNIMSHDGGYHGSPHTGKRNTRTKYTSILHSGVVHAPIAEHGAVLSHGHLSHHYPVEGGYYGRPHTGNYNSRTKWTSIVHGSVPLHHRHFVSVAAAASAPAAAIATASPQPSRSPSAPQSAGKPKVDQAQIDAVQKQYVHCFHFCNRRLPHWIFVTIASFIIHL